MKQIPKDILKFVDYNKETGIFINKRVKRVARSTNSDGYILLRFNNITVLAHRAAWYIKTGCQPEHEIDHINGIRSDNRACNLRDVDRKTNSQNQRNAVKGKKYDAPLGVSWHERAKKWRVMIWDGKKNIYLGLFVDKDEAANVYVNAKRRMHAGCTL